MRIYVAQLNPTVGDFAGNAKKIIDSMQEARKRGADIVLFPELVLCGYPPEDLLLHRVFLEQQDRHLEEIVENSHGLMAIVGVVRRNPLKGEKPLYDSAAVIVDGKLTGFQDKQLLPTYDVFDERRYFEPGSRGKSWSFKGKRIGILICEDIWQHAGAVGYTNYGWDPVEDLAAEGVDLLLTLSASPYHFNKPDLRLKIYEKCAKTLKSPVISCCQVGGNDELVFDGYSSCVDKEGRPCFVAKGFEEDALWIDLSLPLIPKKVFFDPLEDLYRALVLGVRDYFHKLGLTKGCLGLSGGVDSALVACIAVEALGRENVLGMAMPSRFSSEGSLEDARLLAETLGISFETISIEKPFQCFLDLLEPLFKGRESDVTEENLQARIRGMLLMAISNKFGYVVLSTGNKSEMAVGYCTLYGDMCGGLSVISDVTKQQVYALAKWINREREVIPKTTIEKIPSAELRANQKDSDSLPDYAIVDSVVRGYVEELLSVEEIAKQRNIPEEVVRDLVKRIHLAEYKRRQAAPGIRVTRKGFPLRQKISHCSKVIFSYAALLGTFLR